MEKEQLINKVEKRIQDLSYMINTDKTSEKKQYAWQYAREELKMVLKMLNGQ